MWCLRIVSIPDLCLLNYFNYFCGGLPSNFFLPNCFQFLSLVSEVKMFKAPGGHVFEVSKSK